MSFINALFLGALQGVTEFLPVSSSGHLVLIAKGLNVKHPGVTFEVMIHMGTLISIVVCFWGDIREIFVNAFLRFFAYYHLYLELLQHHIFYLGLIQKQKSHRR